MTIFFECAGEHARALLAALQEACARDRRWLGGRLLESAEQPGLYLLVSEWQGEGRPPAVPDGVKVWRFRSPGEPAPVGSALAQPGTAEAGGNP